MKLFPSKPLLPDVKGKVKCTLVQTPRLCTGRTTHRGSRGKAIFFFDHGTRRGEGSSSRPGSSIPPGKTRYPLYRRLDGPQDRSGQVWKISPSPRFDPRTVQPVASPFTDWATGTTLARWLLLINSTLQLTLRKSVVELNNIQDDSGGKNRYFWSLITRNCE